LPGKGDAILDDYENFFIDISEKGVLYMHNILGMAGVLTVCFRAASAIGATWPGEADRLLQLSRMKRSRHFNELNERGLPN